MNKSLGGVSSRTVGDMQNLKPVSSASGGSVNNGDLKVGYNVLHERFGKGKITKIEGQGEDKKATIFFPHHGGKTLLLRFAKLTVID